MAQAKPLIDIKSSRFQEGYKGSTEALPPMRTAPAASVVVKVCPPASANTNQRQVTAVDSKRPRKDYVREGYQGRAAPIPPMATVQPQAPASPPPAAEKK